MLVRCTSQSRSSCSGAPTREAKQSSGWPPRRDPIPSKAIVRGGGDRPDRDDRVVADALAGVEAAQEAKAIAAGCQFRGLQGECSCGGERVVHGLEEAGATTAASTVWPGRLRIGRMLLPDRMMKEESWGRARLGVRPAHRQAFVR
jgi:hypothetical protein